MLLGIAAKYWSQCTGCCASGSSELQEIKPKQTIAVKMHRDGEADPPFELVAVPNPERRTGSGRRARSPPRVAPRERQIHAGAPGASVCRLDAAEGGMAGGSTWTPALSPGRRGRPAWPSRRSRCRHGILREHPEARVAAPGPADVTEGRRAAAVLRGFAARLGGGFDQWLGLARHEWTLAAELAALSAVRRRR